MLSIIICSVDVTLLQQLSDNIAATVGVPYELLVVNNKTANEGICKVYNRLAAKAKYPYLCFVHEDIVLHTFGWGQKILDALAAQNVGLVGVSGATYKSKYPASWSACDKDLYRFSGVQHFKLTGQTSQASFNPLKEKLSEVAVIDGVFMATKKELWQQSPFNEFALTGFHCYDIDLSIQLKIKGYTLQVVQDIRIEHFSEGSMNQNWLDDSLWLHKHYEHQLPIILGEINSIIKRSADLTALISVLSIMLRYKGYKALSLKYYTILITKYLSQNRLSFTKQIAKYIIGFK